METEYHNINFPQEKSACDIKENPKMDLEESDIKAFKKMTNQDI